MTGTGTRGKTFNQVYTDTNPPENSVDDSSASEHTCDKEQCRNVALAKAYHVHFIFVALY